jgi:protein-S-isoprenylcysteine O-methyltransferase Ste14
LIVEGPYRYVRHPVYFRGLLEILGIVLFLNAYWTLLWALPLRYFAFYLRIRLEEHALISYFGEQYSSYCMQTPALLPFIPLFLKKAV